MSRTKILPIPTEEKQEVETVMAFLASLNEREKERFLGFLDGVLFIKGQSGAAEPKDSH